MSGITIYPVSDWNEEHNSLSKDKKCYGIDLGTTATLMCYVDSSNVNLNQIISLPVQFVRVQQNSPLEHSAPLDSEKVDSIVGFYEGKAYVGSNLYHLKGHPGFEYGKNLFYHWKIRMGVDEIIYPDAYDSRINMPYKVAGVILKYIRARHVGNTPLSNAIITVPASFQANQRNDVMRAAEQADIEISENMLIDEPNAAFLGFFNKLSTENKEDWAKNVRNKNVLVVDFGGGTLDLSILNVDFRQDTGITISNRAISRYNDLGGQDIDTLIAEELLVPLIKKIMPNFDELDVIDIENIIIPQLATIGEKLKIGISDRLSLMVVDGDIKDIDISETSFTTPDCFIKYDNEEYQLGDVEITANEFSGLFEKLFHGKSYTFKYIDKRVTSISASISEIIDKTDLRLDEMDYVLFVGGSSFNPFLHSLCKEKLVNSKPLTTHEPDKLVAEGAAVYSYFWNVHNRSLITPITSDVIGVTLKDKRFYPIIESGQTLPYKVSIPDFVIQSSFTTEIIVPVCINGVDYPIGEINAQLPKMYDTTSVVRIDASLSVDKVFKMEVYVDDDLVGDAVFDNPYSNGQMTEEELDIVRHKKRLHEAKLNNNKNAEKVALRSLIWKYYDINDYRGVVESAEDYIKRFSDQDDGVWNMLYIGNKRLGRPAAAKRALERALKLEPKAAYLNYNYAVLLEDNSEEEALKFLEGLDADLQKEIDIKCKRVLLKDRLEQNVNEEAMSIVKEYKTNPHNFTNFTKEILLLGIFRIVNEPYSFVSPKVKKENEDQSKYLDTNNLPFKPN